MSLVLFEIRDNIALLTLNNPAKRNMLTLEVCEMIVESVAKAEKHPDVKALIVNGNGPTFCAGGQLGDITAVETALSKVIVPPNTTAVTVPINLAVTPLSKAPNSFEEPTNIEFTEDTRPRM